MPENKYNSTNKVVNISVLEEKTQYYNDLEDLQGLLDILLDADEVIGPPVDFHNFAINFVKHNDLESCCKVIQKGLDFYPNEVDLLADFLFYGTDCHFYTECNKYYRRLVKIPKSLWTPRAYDFSIRFLQEMYEYKIDEKLRLEQKNIVEEFIVKYPKEERGYFAKALMLRKENPQKSKEILFQAVAELKSCAKCALSLAEIEFEHGEYELALEHIEKCLTSQELQTSVNKAYVYFIRGMTRFSIYISNFKIDNDKLDDEKAKETALQIYSDFRIAKDKAFNLGMGYKKTMAQSIVILESKTNIKYISIDLLDEE